MIISEDDLVHYGILRKSGRYPWGSGDTQNQRNRSFLDSVDHLKKQGLSEKEIVKGLGLESVTQLRALKSYAKNEQRQSNIGMAESLKEKGYSNVAIGQRMGIPESTVRTYLAPGAKEKADILTSTSNMLKGEVDEKRFVDIGKGVEHHIIGVESQIKVSRERLNTAVAMLQEDGYVVHTLPVPQLGTAAGLNTTTKVLTPPGTTQKEVWENRANIQQIGKKSDTGGRTFYGLRPPIDINPNRVSVVYKEDGGGTADGVLYVRPNVDDISLGKANYAQVRVSVGGTHYIKGMAVYKEGLPNGVDLVFNTAKSNTGNKLDAFKKKSDDPDNPFGAIVNQLIADKDTPNERVTSSMNMVYEEGDWARWSKTLSSQSLSKQSPHLAKSQLDMLYERRESEFKEISSLTNPTVKKDLLEKFAGKADASAVHLEAASLPRQAWHVILPLDTISPNEVYAPLYNNGERVALIRHPHGGTFEIPELIVNNHHAPARKALGDVKDAIGIHHSVAARLSGADFDGDTVLVIPNDRNHIKATPALSDLKNFDPKSAYPKYEGMQTIGKRKQREMGDISNLITDMTLKRASQDEIARAVKHSMVIIDADKEGFELNYKQSAIDNGIPKLKEVYQGGARKGASTLISRARSRQDVPQRKERRASLGGPINKETGALEFEPTGRTRTDKKGRTVPVMQRSKKLAETDDAFTLSSGTNMERLYAEHSNKLKALANKARLESVKTPPIEWSPSARKAYPDQIASLNSKLYLAERNAPLERQAQILANAVMTTKRQANPNMDEATDKKIKFQTLDEMRHRTGARKEQIKIDQDEWDAIQAGAISNSKLKDILRHADVDRVRELATPRTQKLMTTAKTNRAKQMLALGYTRAEVAQQLGVSVSTLDASTVEGG